MAALVIFISSDSSDKSVGSHVPPVILFGTIPTSILVILVVPAEVLIAPADPLVAPEVGAVFVISPTGVLDLVDYSSSFDSDPSEDSLPVAPELPLVSPFLCFDDSKANSKSEPAEQRPERHESLTPSSEFPLAPVVAPPRIRRRPTILVRPSEAIPFGRPYRTHPNGPHKLLTARQRVGPFPARRLAWRCVSHRSPDCHSLLDFTSNSSSSSSSSDSSSAISSSSSSDSLSDSSSVHSSGCDASGPSTRVSSPRLVYPPIRTPRCSEAFMHWRSAPLSTIYPPTTSESSLDSSSKRSLDSSSPSARPSRKRYRSPTTLVPSSTPVSRSIAPALADLPPRKRFKDSYSSEAGREEHMEIDMGVEVATSDIREDEEEFEAEASEGDTKEVDVDPLATGGISEATGGDALDIEGTLYDIDHYMSEVSFDRITDLETAQGQTGEPEGSSFVVYGERSGRQSSTSNGTFLGGVSSDLTMTNTRSGMTPAAIEETVNRHVEEALETHEDNKNIGLGNGNDEGGNHNSDGNR
ncbi:hypothetical protein Tco_1044622, partial [Tanacetum coccineum]